MSDNEITILPDGSAFSVLSLPLPDDHWLYWEDPRGFEAPPMTWLCGTARADRECRADMIRAAAKYAIRASTNCGKIDGFDPDALVQNLVVGMLGYWTSDGMSDDDWANP